MDYHFKSAARKRAVTHAPPASTAFGASWAPCRCLSQERSCRLSGGRRASTRRYALQRRKRAPLNKGALRGALGTRIGQQTGGVKGCAATG